MTHDVSRSATRLVSDVIVSSIGRSIFDKKGHSVEHFILMLKVFARRQDTMHASIGSTKKPPHCGTVGGSTGLDLMPSSLAKCLVSERCISDLSQFVLRTYVYRLDNDWTKTPDVMLQAVSSIADREQLYLGGSIASMAHKSAHSISRRAI